MSLARQDAPDASGSCDYDVCEAISQAMTEGAQLVPRARVAQLQARVPGPGS